MLKASGSLVRPVGPGCGPLYTASVRKPRSATLLSSRTEDRATRGRDPSADSAAETQSGAVRRPALSTLPSGDRHQAVNPGGRGAEPPPQTLFHQPLFGPDRACPGSSLISTAKWSQNH